jgi:anti-sigma regulatory factor (Ser/Thr protein kinase)
VSGDTIKRATAVASIRISLPKAAASAAEARLQVGRFAAENGIVAGLGPALLVVSELVTNAVLHGAEPIHVYVTNEADLLRIEVSDGDGRVEQVALQAGAADRPGGRGLTIVNSLATAWGTALHPNGKTVWAEIGLDGLAD